MRRAVSLQGTKEAALYFERVFPLDSIYAASQKSNQEATSASDFLPYDDPRLAIAVLESLIPEENSPLEFILSGITIQLSMFHIINPEPPLGDDELRKICSVLRDLGIVDIEVSDLRRGTATAKGKLSPALSQHIRKHGFENSPAWRTTSADTSVGSLEDRSDAFEFTLKSLNLVDTSRLSWEKVIEFRKDADSFAALRDLRLFFSENFDGKSKDYIEDKLLSLVNRQDKISKLWGFETAQKSLSVAFSNKSAMLGSISGIAASVAGAPLTAVAASAIALPLAGCVLEFAKVAIDAKKEQLDLPIRFLSKIKDLNQV